jgi:hypothetical protein
VVLAKGCAKLQPRRSLVKLTAGLSVHLFELERKSKLRPDRLAQARAPA